MTVPRPPETDVFYEAEAMLLALGIVLVCAIALVIGLAMIALVIGG